MKKIKYKCMFYKFTISYAYETWKGYYRENKVNVTAINSTHAKEVFKEWSKEQRAIVNAKILTIAADDNIILEYHL